MRIKATIVAYAELKQKYVLHTFWYVFPPYTMHTTFWYVMHTTDMLVCNAHP